MNGRSRQWLGRRRSRLGLAALAAASLAGVTLLWLAWREGYRPVRSDGYLWGAYHVHSTLSDGLGTLGEIATAARASGTDFVVLADHGAPNFRATSIAGTIGGIRFIGGSEAGMTDGQLVAIGCRRTPRYCLPPYPPEAVDEIHQWGGLAVVAYPVRGKTPWRDWHDDFRPDGIEVINPSAELRRLNWLQTMGAFHLGLWSEYELLRFVGRPWDVLARWDHLLTRSPVRAYYAVNTHGGFRIDGLGAFRYPSYRAVFNLIGLGVPRQYGSDPLAALRNGDFFCILRGAGEPDLFEFRATAGGLVGRPGGTVPAGARLEGRVRFRGGPTRLVLYRDGRACRDTTGGELCLASAEPGVYRVEARLPAHPLLSPEVPWVLSNPIIVLPAVEPPPADQASHASRPAIPAEPAAPPARWPATESVPEKSRVFPLDLGDFKPEAGPRARVAYRVEAGRGVWDWALPAAPVGEPPVACALALRRNLSLPGVDGFYLRARADEELRCLIELRSGQRWYYASIKLPAGSAGGVRVPLDRFYRVLDSRERPPVENLDSLFLSLNSFILQTPISGRLEIEAAGFYAD